ncbi:MAG: amidase [Verrucomicrobiales bacterium]|jgi:amidase
MFHAPETGEEMSDVEDLLATMDGLGLGELVRDGEVSESELLEASIRRIETLDPTLNAVVQRMFNEARAKTTREPRGLFAGVPFLLKDLNCDYAGVPTSRGNRVLNTIPATHDNVLVERFKATGVSILGKTNVPEFGLQAITEPELFGPARNPWNSDYTPGGSSGGAAAAVAAGYVPVAAAGDGGGSIRIPASYCGLFGLKPSRGRMPLGPDIAEGWFGAAQALVISRTVRDSAAMLDALHGMDVGAPYGAPEVPVPYLKVARRDPQPLRIAISTASPIGTDVDSENRAAAQDTAHLLESLGHHVIERDAPVDGKALARSYFTMYFGDVAATIAEIEQILGRRATLADAELGTLALAAIGRTVSAGDFAQALRHWGKVGRQMGRFFEEVDVYLTPTTAAPPAQVGELTPTSSERRQMKAALKLHAWRAVLKTGMMDEMFEKNLARTPFTQLANVSGLPAMSVPLHMHSNGLPCGVHFIGPYGAEDRLFALAGQLERATPWFDRTPTAVGVESTRGK